MPKLEEIRRWLEGENVEGLPKREGTWDLSKKVETESYVEKCKDCGGVGIIYGESDFIGQACVKCRGKGEIKISRLKKPVNKKKEKCRDCQGNGVNIFGDKCKTCGGKGIATYEKRELECSNCYGSGKEPFTGVKCEICGGDGKIEFDARKDAVGLAKRLTQISKSKGRYKISEKGDDALLKFGKHKGKSLVEIAKRHPMYLDWIIKSEFPEDIKDICRYILNRKKKVR